MITNRVFTPNNRAAILISKRRNSPEIQTTDFQINHSNIISKELAVIQEQKSQELLLALARKDEEIDRIRSRNEGLADQINEWLVIEEAGGVQALQGKLEKY